MLKRISWTSFMNTKRKLIFIMLITLLLNIW